MLFVNGIHLITGIRNNMKNQLMTLHDKIMLRKRSIIETITYSAESGHPFRKLTDTFLEKYFHVNLIKFKTEPPAH